MIWLLLSIFSSAAVALLLKAGSHHAVPRFPLFAVNYTVALLLGLVIAQPGALSREPRAALAIALASGVLYVLGFVVFRRAIMETSTGIAASVSRLSVTGPVLLSVIAFGELVAPLQGVGLVLAVLVLPLSGASWPPWRGSGRPGSSTTGAHSHGAAAGVLWSVALFLIFAVNDGVLKVRTELFPGSDAGLFFAVLFGTAGVASLVLAVVRRERFVPGVLLGVPLGAANYGTAFFLSRALERIPGYQAFTLNSVGVILLVVIAGRLIFGERLARHNYLFLAGSIAAIVLLRVPG